MNPNLIDHIREILHVVAGVLVWPVLLGLILLVAAMLVTLGAFAREAWERRRKPGFRLALAKQELLDIVHADQPEEPLDLRLERLLQDQERRLWQPLARLRLAVRVGPALGLMGTLIPMAHALQ